MGKSNRLRLGEVRRALRLVGECRDVGRDCRAWFAHALRGTRELLRAKVVMGVMASPQGFRLFETLRLVLSVGWDGPAQEQAAMNYLAGEAHVRDPAFQHYQAVASPNLTLQRSASSPRREFEASEFCAVKRELGIRDFIFSQRRTANRVAMFALSTERAAGDPDFDAREAKLMRLLHDELALLAGEVSSDVPAAPLAGLAPRQRQALALLLTGDGGKRIALAMGISKTHGPRIRHPALPALPCPGAG